MYQTLFAYSILSLASQCFAAPVAKSNWPHNTGPEVHDAIASSPGRGHWPHNTGPKVKYAIRKRSGDISKRQAVGVDITNERVKYTMDLEVGTPAQTITLDVDTGSSDIWMFGPRSCSDCVGGVFDPSLSSSAVDHSELGALDVGYGDGSHASGYYIGDTVSFGDATATGVVLGVATDTSSSISGFQGIMGIGLDGGEGTSTQYPGFVDDLYSEGLIGSHSYGIHLDSKEASTGHITFGGYDTDAFTGDLVPLPILQVSGDIPRVEVEWTSLSLTDADGNTAQLTDSSLSQPVNLDTGATLARLPVDVYNYLASYFSVGSDSSISCDLGDGSLTFGFGGGSVYIDVPFSEVPLSNGDGTCQFGFAPLGSDGLMGFGDTFLRSAYAFYDFDDMTISLAQAA